MGTFAGLFHDRVQLCATKSPEDLRNLITARITEQKRVDEQRLEAQREKIRQEEAAKLAREQQEREEAQRRADAQAEAARVAAARAPAAVAAPAPVVASAPVAAAPALSQAAKSLAAPAPAQVVCIKLGDINAKIAPLTITADGLAQLGFQPVTIERASKLYDAAQLPAMFSAMQQVFARAANNSYQQAA
ncbi:hypothetical protein [Xanthomonas axonopodis]|uniref:hypothetical protein n=1 Tax=Xanthomonas axonopodis TaxID=53413 RepID=UPI0013CF0F85|nr:hypothetical protein [Xanthomonas axonopodis]